MKTAVILAAGPGTRIWPYAVIRPKVMIPVANKPIIAYMVAALKELKFHRVIIAADLLAGQIENYFRLEPLVEVIRTGQTAGAADTLFKVYEYIKDDNFLVFYGDTYITKQDIDALIKIYENKGLSVLINPLKEENSRD